MRQQEAVQLLQADLGVVPTESEKAAFYTLATKLGEWPLLLTLANGILRKRLRSQESLQIALAHVQRLFTGKGVLAFDPKKTRERHEG
jgi:hypothetical protein